LPSPSDISFNCIRLKEAGVRVFADVEGVSAGEDLSRTVHRALREADEVVILLTDNVAANSNVMFEFGVADALDKRVTPVVVTEGVERLLPMIGSHFIKYGDLPKYISSLKKRLKAA
jgi:nucleoside 2-deoxyribosyltransferase